LIKAKADVNARQEDHWTALHLAAKNGHGEAVKALIEGSAAVDAQEKYEATALHLAAQNGHSEPVRACWTPLNVAANNGHLEVVKFLFGKKGWYQDCEL
jgi:ankyrin repeat protein